MTEPDDYGPPPPALPDEGVRECGHDHGFAVWTTPEWLRWYFAGTEAGDAIDTMDDDRLADVTRRVINHRLTERARDDWLESLGEAIARLANN